MAFKAVSCNEEWETDQEQTREVGGFSINFQDTIEGDTAADGANDLSEGIALLEAAGIDK